MWRQSGAAKTIESKPRATDIEHVKRFGPNFARLYQFADCQMRCRTQVLLQFQRDRPARRRQGGCLTSALGMVMWWKSKRKGLIALAGVFGIAIAAAALPQKYYDRINTLGSYEEDGSATGRLDIWAVSIDIANRRPILGGGFYIHTDDYAYVNQRPDFFRKSFHSIYFEVLAYHGYVGLLLFLALGTCAYFTCGWIKNQTKDRPDLQGDYTLAMMMQCSVTVYAVSGASQNLAHYDLYYGLLAIIVIHRHIIGEKLKVPAAGEAQATEVPGNDYPEPGGVLQPAPAFAAARGVQRSFLRSETEATAMNRGKSFLRQN